MTISKVKCMSKGEWGFGFDIRRYIEYPKIKNLQILFIFVKWRIMIYF